MYSQENEACGGPLSEHSVPLSESNVSTIPGFPSFPSSAFPSPNSNYISTELNNRLIPKKISLQSLCIEKKKRKYFVRYELSGIF